MIKHLLMAATLFASTLTSYAQTEGTKKLNHYAGVQANQLFRQILNLNTNNNNLAVNNPYLLTYSVNLAKSGWGVAAGVGYNFQELEDKGSPANRQSKLNDLFYRAGLERKRMLGKRFEAGFGLDFIGSYLSDRTVTVTATDFGSGITDSSVANVASKTTSIGGGAKVNLGLYLSSHIILGTEATYYFSKATVKQNIFVEDTFTDFSGTKAITTSNTNTESGEKKFAFGLPVAIFLIVKF